MVLRQLWREPLVHFLAIGAGLFALFHFTAGTSGKTSSGITITQGQIERMATGYARTWQRPPSEDERKALIDDYVREEIAYREAMAMGLDREDAIIRRRLRQKLEFVWEEGANAAPVTDADLAAWLREHAASFRLEPQVAFRQVYLNETRRGQAAREEAVKLLGRLNAAGPGAPVATVGDPLMVPNEFGLVAKTEVARLFGAPFADELLKVAPGRWAGPLESGYGLHLVLVTKMVEGRVPELSEVRPAVERELIAARRKEQLEATYRKLLERYKVVIDKPPPSPVAR